MSYFSIYDTNTRRYWQCGTWVHMLSAATKYMREDDANAVVAMRYRSLYPHGDGAPIVVGNDTEYIQHVPIPVQE